jgi:alpha-methylacyl-CoA racemase
MGPLQGYTIIEFAGIGPCPMAGMLFADMGAKVIRIDREAHRKALYQTDISARGKRSIVIDLKNQQGRELALKLIENADALIEGHRPGVMEKLGIGPNECFAINPALVFGRMTGWGQEGPLAQTAGHDINYIALTGALHAIGRAGEPPVPPLNLVGDFGGGAMFLVCGVLAALLESKQSGRGQVVDAAMVDGSANLMWMCHSFAAANRWNIENRGSNLVDGGAFFYDCYETLDNKYIAVGPIESHFFQEFVALADLNPAVFNPAAQLDQSQWPHLKQLLRHHIKAKTQQQWCDIFGDSDACVTPILTLSEAPEHPHHKARATYQTIDGLTQPSPAPRFSRTPSTVQHAQQQPGQDTQSILQDLNLTEQEINALYSAKVVR